MHLNFIRGGRGTTHNLVCNKKNVLHFNPRPREGDDPKAIELVIIYKISIHVPVRGTTQRRLNW